MGPLGLPAGFAKTKFTKHESCALAARPRPSSTAVVPGLLGRGRGVSQARHAARTFTGVARGGRTAPAPGRPWLRRGARKFISGGANSLGHPHTQRSRVVLFSFGAPTPPTITPSRRRRYHRVAVLLLWLHHPSPAHAARALAQKDRAHCISPTVRAGHLRSRTLTNQGPANLAENPRSILLDRGDRLGAPTRKDWGCAG